MLSCAKSIEDSPLLVPLPESSVPEGFIECLEISHRIGILVQESKTTSSEVTGPYFPCKLHGLGRASYYNRTKVALKSNALDFHNLCLGSAIAPIKTHQGVKVSAGITRYLELFA